MDDFAFPAEPLNGSQKPQVLVIIEHQVLARTCILSILKRELAGFEIVEIDGFDEKIERAPIHGGPNISHVAVSGEDHRFHHSIVERVQWWAEVFEPPCVGFAAALGEVAGLTAAGADFILLGDAVWSDARGELPALEDATAEIAKGMTAPVPERQT